ncbi:DNA-3-methyladenine glycosylase 2 family protein [Ralstonia mannitolilytica]|uniref:DNA-3-methyladenine glycosylase II n=1 Tax=Ralstonia mannitolilytica TaxID=105219 RepID=A0AAJ5D5I6_9RALS|nr:DNA-3-methyladenine glycosylase 2 [Ralstonia mannitolilytica]CAG2144446.1 putative bifunctional transcriptional activator/DNA repair enzyme AlkA [Ralstonia mannitolilytica]CAJ0723818.1 putative bifunctional transcriptional activator/DNA repair enzyme AlkA [Ralstonia mannitolilytica]SUD88600.1 DNA-3-methyladenine glycosylase 2 [Ralstonia mannitolilytica]SUD94563.1 DNA-3-methyladenine glycosylase 2 [Ralstonia mannitolilytica]SUD98260.1 DNA-3-methyladenine glycosylase 2 [Ralstonia mannitolilyt
MHLDHNACYHAVRSRDRRFDGWFFVGVTSTGVYCRPVCAVRTPQQKNCRFFATAAAAERAGFRPCLRCRPELAPGHSLAEMSSDLARAAARMIDEGFLQEHDLAALAAAVGVTDRHLRRIFRAEFDVSPIDYAQTQRLLLAKRLLTDTALPVGEVAFAAGFGSVRRLNSGFTEQYGFAPTRLRARAAAARSEDGPTLMLGYRPPFAWHALLAFLGARAVEGVEQVDADSYARTITVDYAGMRHTGWLHARNVPQRHAVALTLSPSLLHAIPPVLARVRRLFDLDCRPDLVDGHLGALAAGTPGLRVPGAVDGFEIAVRAIAGQVVSLAQARRMLGRLTAAYGTPLAQPREGVSTVFPSAATLAQVAPQALSTQTGLQASRAAAVVQLARAIDAGDLRLEPLVPLAPTLAALQALPGVGEWTAQYVAMRALGWPNAFPLGDYVLRKRLADAHGALPTRRAMVERAEPWAPWRAYAAMHLWHREDTLAETAPG